MTPERESIILEECYNNLGTLAGQIQIPIYLREMCGYTQRRLDEMSTEDFKRAIIFQVNRINRNLLSLH